MNEDKLRLLCRQVFSREPEKIERGAVGIANYVYILDFADEKAVLRLSREENAYRETLYWLPRLAGVGIPVPRVLGNGRFGEYDFIALSYIPGKDLGVVYPLLSAEEKRQIAKSVIDIQKKAACLAPGELAPDWKWESLVRELLEHAEALIRKNGWFDPEKVRRVSKIADSLRGYFDTIKPVVYLDDITTKNLMIEKGRVSGVIDVDWIGIGDRLTYAALTRMSLLNMEQDTDYVNFLLEEMQLSPIEEKAMRFYTLMYCVEFMGERGTTYLDKTVEVNETIIGRLNTLYERLMREFEETE